MIRRPPRSTPFPTRRSSDLLHLIYRVHRDLLSPCDRIAFSSQRRAADSTLPRSEEHTSELQSHVNLVCRLLLEKKKKNNTIICIITTTERDMSNPIMCQQDS